MQHKFQQEVYKKCDNELEIHRIKVKKKAKLMRKDEEDGKWGFNMDSWCPKG